MPVRSLLSLVILVRSSEGGSGGDCGDKDLVGIELPGDWMGVCDVRNLSMADYGLHWFRQIAKFLNTNFQQVLLEAYREIGLWAIRTPRPGSGAALVLGRPNGGLWAEIYDTSSAAGGGKVFTMALLVLVAAVAARQLVGILNVGSAYGARAARRKLWVGLVVVVCWYWIGVVTLSFAGALTAAFMPSPDAFGETMTSLLDYQNLDNALVLNPFVSIPLFSLGVFAFLGLKALFLFRNLLLVVYMLGGPVLAALAFSGIPVLEDYCRSILGQFVPMAFLSVPAALVFRGVNLLVEHTDTFLIHNAVSKVLVFTLVPGLALLVSLKTFKMTNPVAADLATAPMKWGGRIGMVAGAVGAGSPRLAMAPGHSGTRGVARHAERELLYRHHWTGQGSETADQGANAGGATDNSKTGRRADAIDDATRGGRPDGSRNGDRSMTRFEDRLSGRVVDRNTEQDPSTEDVDRTLSDPTAEWDPLPSVPDVPREGDPDDPGGPTDE